MSVNVEYLSRSRHNGSVEHIVRISCDDGCKVTVSESVTAAGPNQQPTLQRAAELAYEKLHRIARDAGTLMYAHGLLVKKLPDQGPYR